MTVKRDIGLFQKVLNNLVKTVHKSSFNKKVMSALAEEAVGILFKRVKSGKGVSSDTSKEPNLKRLKALKRSYIERRKRAKGTGSFFGPAKSNLTLTGKMLDAMGFKLKKNGFSLFINNRPHSNGNTNKDIAGFVRKIRPFFALAKPEQLILKRKFQGIIRKVAKELQNTVN